MTGFGNYWIDAPETLNGKAWFVVYAKEEEVEELRKQFMSEMKMGNGYGCVHMNSSKRMYELCGNQQPMPLIKGGEVIYDGKVVARLVDVIVDKKDRYCGKLLHLFCV